MIRAVAAASAVLLAAVAVAQTTKTPNDQQEPQTTSTLIPEIPAGADPMNRSPDPAAGTPAAQQLLQPDARGDTGADCRVRRADTDTGFVVVCEEDG